MTWGFLRVPTLFPSLSYMSIRSLRRGFTLIELLLVIGIIAILAAIVIVAINPTKQLGDARNAQRRSDVNTILNAVYQFSIDNRGALPPTITTSDAYICTVADNPVGTCPSLIDLATTLTDNGKYLVSIPKDPKATAPDSGYTIKKDATTGRVTVAAPLGAQEDNPADISVTR